MTVGGLSRFAADLPEVEEFVSLGEGGTPLVALDVLAKRLGLAGLSAKMESMNPTGSYKDRVAALSLSLARQRGYLGWIATSSGNAGLAMAAYGARAGMPGFLCLVASAPLEKRLPLMPYGVHVIAVEGVGVRASAKAEDGLFAEVCAAAERHQLFLGITAHAFNPEGMRGIDTIGYELAEQNPTASHVYVPTGGGGLLVAIARGLRARGVPARAVACQPAGCAPVVRYLAGEVLMPHVSQCDSGISALQLPHPPDGLLAADAVTASGGWGTSISDGAILASQRLLAATEGVFVEPASAAALAALIADVNDGRVGSDDQPVLVLSGAGWKNLGRFSAQADNLPVAAVVDVADHVSQWVTEVRDDIQ